MKKTLLIALFASLSFNAVGAERVQTQAPSRNPQLPVRAVAKLPDYVVEHAGKIGGSAKEFMVKIKNAGTADAPSALASAANMTPGYGGSTTQGFPPIKAGSFIWVKLTLSKAPRPGSRIWVRIDHNKAIAEKNEANNDYYFNW